MWDFAAEMQAHQLRIDALKANLDVGSQRLAPAKKLAQSIDETKKAFDTLFVTVDVEVGPPAQHSMGARLLASVWYYCLCLFGNGRAARAWWDKWTGPRYEPMIVPRDAKLREAWRQQQMLILERDVPTLNGGADHAIQAASNAKDRLHALQDRLEQAKQIAYECKTLVSVPVQRTFLSRLREFWTTWSLNAFRLETTTRVEMVPKVVSMTDLLNETVPELKTCQDGVAHHVTHADKDWQELLNTIAAVNPSDAKP